MLSKAERKLVWVLILVAYLCGAGLSEALRPGHSEYTRAALALSPEDYRDTAGSRGWLKGTAFQTLLPTVLGIREVLASLMWVQTDHYFHTGEYRPIIRMVRQITAIDPHQIDVYATGAWHMAYNFMDKRLIEDGIAFLEEGCRNNRTVYDLFFELGYMHYDKTKDFPKAVAAYAQSAEKGTTTGKKVAPSFVRHQLAHAIEKMGDIDAAIQQWDTNLRVARTLKEEGEEDSGPSGANTQAARHNLYITQRRLNERQAAQAERERRAADAVAFWERNVALAQRWLEESPGRTDITKDLNVARAHVARLKAGRLREIQPTDPRLSFTVTRTEPRKLLIEGRCNVLDLSRVHIRFEDRDYALRAANFDNKMENCTLEWDNPSVRNGAFKFLLDLNRDPADMERSPETIYPLKADEYVLTVSYNPRLQSAFIQDVYGWNGEGLTATGGLLKIDEQRAGVQMGKRIPLRTIERTVILKREDILADGKKVLFRG